MKTFRCPSLFAVGLLAAATSLPSGTALAHPPHDHPRPVVQLALLLDTSNSMDGLIDQARSRLWQVVNDLAESRCDGLRPRLEVALFEYGNNNLDPAGGYIRKVSGFSDDLDLISAALFSLTTNGGDEYCGMVIDRALSSLAWSRGDRDLRMIFIAGNEPFTQGPIDFRPVVRRAAARGISVNTIFCGPSHEGILTHWRDGAVLAGGTYASINQDRIIPHIDAPQDRELQRLNKLLNETYLAYGAEGRARAELQRQQDANAAAAAPEAFAGRIASKATSLYTNKSWDLVDAVKEGEVELDELQDSDLPPELRGLSAAERKAQLETAARKRAELQRRIKELSEAREAYVAEQRQRLAAGDGEALDEAIRKSVREQAAKKNYTFEAN